jgi:hypothetical protein
MTFDNTILAHHLHSKTIAAPVNRQVLALIRKKPLAVKHFIDEPHIVGSYKATIAAIAHHSLL